MVSSDKLIENLKNETTDRLTALMKDRLEKIILFGSYARGNFTEGSDIDIAVMIKGDRRDSAEYMRALASISTDMDLRDMTVVNFICIPYDEYISKKSYYPFYRNIDNEGVVLYG